MIKIVGLWVWVKVVFVECEGVNLIFLLFFVKVVIDVFKIYLNINVSYNEDIKEIIYYDVEYLGFVVDIE